MWILPSNIYFSSYKILEIYSGMQLNYLERVFFWILLSSVVRLNQNWIYPRANSASQIRQNPSWYFSQCPMNSEVFQSGCWKQEPFLASYELHEFFLLLFSFSMVLDYFFPCTYWRLKEGSLQIFRDFSMHSPLSAGCWPPCHPTAISSTQETAGFGRGSPFCHVTWNLSGQVGGAIRGLNCFPFPKDLSPSLSFFFSFFFLGPYPRHMEIPRLGVESELQLSPYSTATAMQDPSQHLRSAPQFTTTLDP